LRDYYQQREASGAKPPLKLPLSHNTTMLTQPTTNEALVARQFLVDRVIEQASREQVQLSDVEKRMLKFSEVMDHDPEYAASEVFDKQYDCQEYESKISGLLKRAYALDKDQDKASDWKAALHELKDQDCYVLVMVDQAGLSRSKDLQSDLRSWLPGKRDLLLILAFLLVFSAGGYVIFFRLSNDWAKFVCFVFWALALWGVARIRD
jgi:hypothetical protein